MTRAFRGTYDQLPEIAQRQQYITDTARDVSSLYGYSEMATPIFEYAEVFSRTLGESSDVVTKEMFAFEDRHGDKLVLRPEGTAGIMRAVLSNKLTHLLPQKYFYAGPMFRYERPQKGRYRQFHQIGVEFLGDSAPGADVEVMTLAWQLFGALGLQQDVVLELNTLGDQESRDQYRKVLVEYFSDVKADLSEDSQRRLETNPLRILDSKNPGDQALVEKAPTLKAYLNQASRDFFGAVRAGLDVLKIPYQWNPCLVRGLDYYSHTAFEFTSDKLGAQSAVLAGGRYDGLATLMGAKDPIPGIGWAAGIERLNLMLEEVPTADRPITLVPIGPEAEEKTLLIAHDLRMQGVAVVMPYKGNLKSRMKYANKINARMALLLGEDELAQGVVVAKDLDKGEQETVALDQLVDYVT